jgi:hypothetical protein
MFPSAPVREGLNNGNYENSKLERTSERVEDSMENDVA